MSKYTDIGVEKHGHVGLIEIRKPPLNFFDVALINQIAGRAGRIRQAISKSAPRCSPRKARRSAPAPISPIRSGRSRKQARKSDPAANLPINHLYVQAVRIFRNKKPIVAAVHGAAIGGGLGLAVSADFRVTCPEARFCRQLHKARLPSRLRPDRDAARAGRQEQRGIDFLHQPPRHRRGSDTDGPRQCLRAAGSGARRGHEARAGNRRMLAARPDLDPRHHARRPRRPRARRHQPRAGRADASCAPRRISRKASRPPPNAASRISRGGEVVAYPLFTCSGSFPRFILLCNRKPVRNRKASGSLVSDPVWGLG